MNTLEGKGGTLETYVGTGKRKREPESQPKTTEVPKALLG